MLAHPVLERFSESLGSFSFFTSEILSSELFPHDFLEFKVDFVCDPFPSQFLSDLQCSSRAGKRIEHCFSNHSEEFDQSPRNFFRKGGDSLFDPTGGWKDVCNVPDGQVPSLFVELDRVYLGGF